MTPAPATVPPPPERSANLRRATEILDAPRRAIGFTIAVALAAAIAAGWGVTRPLPPIAGLVLAERVLILAALAGLAQVVRLRFRLGSGTVAVGWAEAAVIIGLYLMPAGWLPAATLVGAGSAWLLLAAFTTERSPVEGAYGAASFSLAATAAAAVATSVATPFDAQVNAATATALGAAGGTYLLVTVLLDAVWLRLQHGGSTFRLAASAVAVKLPIFAGNVVAGLAVVALLSTDPRWLPLLVPVFWLLQRGYQQHVNAREDRRAWLGFAAAAAALARPDQPDVVPAAVRGARELFGAPRVDLDVTRPDGTRRYVDTGGLVEEVDAVDAPRAPGSVISRSMVAGDVPVGELTVWLPDGDRPSARDELILAAYADALGVALHGVAMRERVDAVTAKSSHEAAHDALTGLGNRAALLSGAGAALRATEPGHPVALLLFDLKDFKNVNGTLGHSAGDHVLRVVAGRLLDAAERGELVVRLGDDEFALLVPRPPTADLGRDVQDAAVAAVAAISDSGALDLAADGFLPQIQRRARGIVEALRAPAEIADVRLVVECAAGVVTADCGEVDAGELVRRAEIALEHAKALGGVVAYHPGLDTASTDRLVLLADFREALRGDDQLVLAMQPAVDLETGEPTGVEALIRWDHPRRGLLYPGEFIRVVEHSDVLGEFTGYVLNKSLAVAARWHAAGIDVPISVNVSARSLLDETLPAQVDEALRRHRVPASRLVLEITETVAVVDFGVADDVVNGLRELGVQLSLDDFGTGYSSLAFLARVPVDELKVDRSFVERMADSVEAAAIVRSTVDLGRGLNVRVVAEGVETADQRAALVALGCTAAQGYHFCKPMPSEEIVPRLRSLAAAATAKVLRLRVDGAS